MLFGHDWLLVGSRHPLGFDLQQEVWLCAIRAALSPDTGDMKRAGNIKTLGERGRRCMALPVTPWVTSGKQTNLCSSTSSCPAHLSLVKVASLFVWILLGSESRASLSVRSLWLWHFLSLSHVRYFDWKQSVSPTLFTTQGLEDGGRPCLWHSLLIPHQSIRAYRAEGSIFEGSQLCGTEVAALGTTESLLTVGSLGWT